MRYLKRFLENVDIPNNLKLIEKMLSEIDELRYILQDEGYDIVLNEVKTNQLLSFNRTVVHFKNYVDSNSYDFDNLDCIIEFMDRVREICSSYGFETSDPLKTKINVTDDIDVRWLCFEIKHKSIKDDKFNKDQSASRLLKISQAGKEEEEEEINESKENVDRLLDDIKSITYILGDVGVDVHLYGYKKDSIKFNSGKIGIRINNEHLNNILKSSKRCVEFVEAYCEFIDRLEEICAENKYKLFKHYVACKIKSTYIYSDLILEPNNEI